MRVPALFLGEGRKWWTLAAVSFGLFMIMLDNTVVNVALPSIQRDLDASLSQLEWIVAGYALSFASLMLIGGKLADAYGRRRIFVLGIAVFTVASLLCGLANSGETLVAARVLQGAGAALMNPATLSIIAATFPPSQRGAAIGIWAGVSALALAIGPLVGGLIVEHLAWSWIFFVNVPIGILGIVASYLLIDESKDETHERLDIPGLVTSAIGLFALTFALIEGNGHGWTSAVILGSFALAAVSLATFILLERHQRAPMLPLGLFRNATYTGSNVVILLVALAMFGVFFFVSLYLQNVLGYSPVQTGAAFLPMTLMIILFAPVAGRMSDRIGSRVLMTAGMILVGIHLLLFSRLGADADFWDLLPALMLGGIGMAITMTPSAAAATRAVPVDKAGVGAAVLNAFRQVGGSLGIAAMGAIMAARIGDPPTTTGFLDGFQRALEVAAVIAFLGAIVAFTLVRPHGSSESRRSRDSELEPGRA
jgi:EmrB/QacA subfamily drug resistance transporter